MLRILEILLPRDQGEKLREVVEDSEECRYVDIWCSGESEADDTALYRVLVEAEDSEKVADILEEAFSDGDRFRMAILSVEATLPRAEEEVSEEDEKSERIGREELYNDISGSAVLSLEYMTLACLATVVAAIGLLRDNVAVVIGAMVIAPLLGPSMALSLATTLGDLSLMRKAGRTALVGIALSLVLSICFGFLFAVDPENRQIAVRTSVQYWDVFLALAVGVAGALAFTTGVSSALVGVMVAVALLPPLVRFGLLIGSANFSPAFDAIVLTGVNLVGINLAAVVTFMAQGIYPARWWEKDRAKKRSRWALALWLTTLAILLFLIEIARRYGAP